MRLIKFIIFFILTIYFLNIFNINIYYYIINLKINIILIITFIIDLLQNFIELINQNDKINSIDDLNNDSIEKVNEEIKVFYKNKYFWFITGIVILSLLYYNSNINYITDNNIINNTTLNIINTSNTLNNINTNTVLNLLPLNNEQILDIGNSLNNSLNRNEELIEELTALLDLFS